MIQLLAFTMVVLIAAQDEKPSEINRLSWMTGAWVMEKGSLRVEEYWTRPRAGNMMGAGRTMKGDTTVFYEHLRIEQTGDGIVYHASPKGRGATPFRMIEMSDDKVVFENAEHDFPQRIIYWREADGSMGARIEGKRNGKDASESWLFRPMGSN